MKMESRLKSRFNLLAASSGRLLHFVFLVLLVLSNSSCKQAEEWIGSGRKAKVLPGLPDISPSNVKAELVNTPSDGAADGSLSVLVGGDGVVGYIYKLGAAASLDCSDQTGYSLTRVSAQVINDSIDSMIGSMGICVLGFDSEGRRQSIDDPTRYVWNRSWYPEVMIESLGRQVVSDANVTLRLHAPASYAEVYLTNDMSCTSGGVWQAWAASMPWTLTVGASGSTSTVYARFRKASGAVSGCTSDSVTYNPVSAEVFCSGATSTTNLAGVITDSGGASADYQDSEDCTFTITSTPTLDFTFPVFSTESGYDYLEAYADSVSAPNQIFSISGTTAPLAFSRAGTTVFRFFSDGSVTAPGFAVNWSLGTVGMGTSVLVNNGDASATSLGVSLALTASSNFREMYITETPGCGAGGTWETKSATRAWTFSAGDGERSIYVKFRDWEGAETVCESDSINLYVGTPVATLTGAPADNDGADDLFVTVGGTTVASYRYKVGAAASINCADPTGYSGSQVNVATAIADSLVSYPSGSMRICVVGRNPIGVDQPYASATVHTWFRNVPAFVELAESGSIISESAGAATFRIQVPSAPLLPITVSYDFFGEMVPVLGLTSGQAVIPAGQTYVDVSVPFAVTPAANIDRRISLGISAVTSPHRIGVQSLSSVMIRDDNRTDGDTVRSIGPNGYCMALQGGALVCSGMVGGYTTGTARFSHGFERISPAVNFKEVVADGSHYCALSTADELYCWGWGFDGQLGLGSQTDQSVPVKVPGLTWKSVVTSHTWNNLCGISSTDDLYCWGDQTYSNGTVGNGTTNDERSPLLIDGSGTKYASVTIEDKTACAISTTGALRCWGDNSSGMVGDGSTTHRYAPVAIDAGTAYSKVVIRWGRSCGITTAGALKCWGSGVYGVGSTPTVVDSSRVYTTVAVANRLACAVSGGALYCYGKDDVDLGTNTTTMVAVDSGTAYTQLAGIRIPEIMCGLRSDGRVKCFGAGLVGSSNDADRSYYPKVPTLWDANTFASIQSTPRGICGITTSGYAKCLTDSVIGALAAPVAEARDATEIVNSSISFNMISDRCGIDSNNKLRCWKAAQSEANRWSYSKRTNPVLEHSSLSFTTMSSKPSRTSCGILTSGALVCWGSNTYGAVGDGTNTDRDTPVTVDSGTSYSAVAVSSYVGCGITTTGELKCWGDNSQGSLGAGDTTNRLTPYSLGTGFVKIAVSDRFVCAIKTGDHLFCWGKNGTLGIGNGSAQSLVPVELDAATLFKEVKISGSTACAIRSSDSRVLCWGHGVAMGDGTTTNRTVPTLTADSSVYLSLHASAETSWSGGAMCGTTAGTVVGDRAVKCWGGFRWPVISTPMAIYDGPFSGLGWSTAETVLIIDSSGRVRYFGRADGVPGVPQTLKYFEVIQGLVDRVLPNN